MIKKILSLTFIFNALYADFIPTEPQTVTDWYLCTKNATALNPAKPVVSYTRFISIINDFINQQTKNINNSIWFGSKIEPYDPNFNTLYNPSAIKPFVAKLKLPHATEVFCWGDLHGDIQSLAHSLYKLYQDGVIDNNLKIKSESVYFLFLGDLVDRGLHGAEVMALLFSVALKNPEQVIIIRGNHEDLYQNVNMGGPNFLKDLLTISGFEYRSPECTDLLNSINHLYNLLPVACFVGCNNDYIQCCHGGLECRYNPNNFLNAPIKRSFNAITELTKPESFNLNNPYFWHEMDLDISCNTLFKNIPANQIKTLNLGFMWNDFNAHPDQFKALFSTQSRSGRFSIGQTLTHETLKIYNSGKAQLRGFIRAHQHNDTMPGLLDPRNTGIFSMWENTVITTVSTCQFGTPISFLKLTLKDNYDNWLLMNYSFNQKEQTWKIRESPKQAWQNIVSQ